LLHLPLHLTHLPHPVHAPIQPLCMWRVSLWKKNKYRRVSTNINIKWRGIDLLCTIDQDFEPKNALLKSNGPNWHTLTS
jgi:hypothetical protein